MKPTSLPVVEDLKSEDQDLLSSLNLSPSPANLLISSDGVPSTQRNRVHDVFSIEREMLKRPQVELPYKEYRTDGVYARELTIYAGCVLTGHAHRYPQVNILSAGTIRVLTEEGIVEKSAPWGIGT